MAHFTTLYTNWGENELCECGAANIIVVTLPGYKHIDHSGVLYCVICVLSFSFYMKRSNDSDDLLSLSRQRLLVSKENSRCLSTWFKKRMSSHRLALLFI